MCACFQGIVQREKLLESVLGWRERVEGGVEGLPKKGPDWTVDLGQWLAGIRMDGVKITQPPGERTLGQTSSVQYYIISTSNTGALSLQLPCPQSRRNCDSCSPLLAFPPSTPPMC